MTQPLLQFQDVAFQWAGEPTPLFQGMTWSMDRGESYLLDAPSGKGKTTLLRLAAGTLIPTGGKIIRGAERIGFVFQDQRLLPWLTVQQNLQIVMAKPEKTKITRALETLGLTEKENTPAKELSGGEAQRINLLRAILHAPQILLLDEPFNGLDAKNQDRCAELIREWLEQDPSRGILMASHIPQKKEFPLLKKLPLEPFSPKS